jgi:hypothetical protein
MGCSHGIAFATCPRQGNQETCASGRSENLINQVAPGGHEAAAIPQSTSSEGVVAATRWYVPGELGHRVPYKEADDRGQQERERHDWSGLECDDRERKHNVGCRCDVRDTLEHQLRKTERIASKLRIRIGIGGLSAHLTTSFSKRSLGKPCPWPT